MEPFKSPFHCYSLKFLLPHGCEHKLLQKTTQIYKMLRATCKYFWTQVFFGVIFNVF